MDTNQNIQQAVMMVKQGNREGALQIINRILEDDPLNERAWMAYAYAVPDRQTGIQALQKVLKLNPNYQAVRRQLDLWALAPGSINQAPAPIPEQINSAHTPGGFNPAPEAEQFAPAPASNFVYTPIPDPTPTPEELPSWLAPTLAAEEAAPETSSAFGVYTGYQGATPEPSAIPLPAPAEQNLTEDLTEVERPEEETGDPTIRLLQRMAAAQESSLEEQKKNFKYLVEYNNNLASVLNSYSRQMTELRRQMGSLFTSVLVMGGLLVVAIIVLLIK